MSAGTSRSATWTVASTTRSAGDSNIIATNGLPVRWPSRSVCPFQGNPASGKRFFAHRRGRNGVHLAALGPPHGRDDGVVGGLAGGRRDLADRHAQACRRADDDRLADLAHARVGGGHRGDLRADAGRVATVMATRGKDIWRS